MKKTAKVLAGVVAAGALVLGTSLPANASGFNAQLSHGASTTYLGVGGAGRIVTSIEIGHNHVLPTDGNICGTKIRYRGTLHNQTATSRTSAFNSACYFSGVSWVFSENYTAFRGGTSIYGEFYHDGAWTPGTDPSVGIIGNN